MYDGRPTVSTQPATQPSKNMVGRADLEACALCQAANFLQIALEG